MLGKFFLITLVCAQDHSAAGMHRAILLPLLACSSGRLTRIAHHLLEAKFCLHNYSQQHVCALSPHNPLRNQTTSMSMTLYCWAYHLTKAAARRHTLPLRKKEVKEKPTQLKKKIAHKQALLMLVKLKEPNPTLKTAKVPHSFRLHQNGLTGGR